MTRDLTLEDAAGHVGEELRGQRRRGRDSHYADSAGDPGKHVARGDGIRLG